MNRWLETSLRRGLFLSIFLEFRNFKLENNRDNKATFISNCKTGEVITIYGGDTLQIESNIDHDFSDFNYHFPRLKCEYRNYKNVFTSSLKCTISMQYVRVRKVGL